MVSVQKGREYDNWRRRGSRLKEEIQGGFVVVYNRRNVCVCVFYIDIEMYLYNYRI